MATRKASGKRRAAISGRPGDEKQEELPGVTIDERKVKKIEDAAEEQERASKALSAAHEAFEEAADTLVEVMDEHKCRVYTRVPWGTVSIPTKKTPKRRAKFRRLTQAAKKEKDISEQED
jgi:major membrane immunogen (membrane-anchored lipoprotein)